MWEPEPRQAAEPSGSTDEKSGGVLSWFAKAKQGLTGGAAEVYLSPLSDSVKPGETIELKIDVHVSEFELNAKEVTIEFVGEEMVVLPWHSVRLAMGSKFDAFREAWNFLLSSGKFSHQDDWEEYGPGWGVKHMTFLPQTETLPPGIRVAIDGVDQWGERRKVQQTFRATRHDLANAPNDEWPEGFFETYERAWVWREKILALRDKLGHLPFSHPAKKKRG